MENYSILKHIKLKHKYYGEDWRFFFFFVRLIRKNSFNIIFENFHFFDKFWELKIIQCGHVFEKIIILENFENMVHSKKKYSFSWKIDFIIKKYFTEMFTKC